jgi:hypothetical protein
MPACNCHSLTIDQGATFRQVLRWRDEDGVYRDLTEYTARLIAADAAGDSFLDLTSEDGDILLEADGTITIMIAKEVTVEMQPQDGLEYNLELTSPEGHLDRLMEGNLYISPRLPRED